MRPVTFVLIALLAFVQYPLWWGTGGWLRVHDLQDQFAAQLRTNTDLKGRNDRIAGEVDDLQNGTAAVEERARYELGMVKSDEVYVQYVSPQDQARLPVLSSNLPSTRGQVSAAPLRVVPEPPAHGRAETKRLEAAAARHKAGAEKSRATRGATSPNSDR